MSIHLDPYYTIDVIDLSDNTQVNSGGGSNTQNLRPSQGFVYEVICIYMSIPAIGGASGDHKIYIRYNDGSNNMNVGQLVGTDGAVMSIDGQYGFVASTEYPSGINQQYDIISKILKATYDNYIDFYYLNNSDSNQTGTRTLKIWVKILKESV